MHPEREEEGRISLELKKLRTTANRVLERIASRGAVDLGESAAALLRTERGERKAS